MAESVNASILNFLLDSKKKIYFKPTSNVICQSKGKSKGKFCVYELWTLRNLKIPGLV